MSAVTKTALDDAISAHIADDNPDYFASGWALIVAVNRIDDEGGTTIYYKEFSPDLPLHTSMGLAHYLVMSLDADASEGGF